MTGGSAQRPFFDSDLASKDINDVSRIILPPEGRSALLSQTVDAAAPSELRSFVLAHATVADDQEQNVLKTLANTVIASAKVQDAAITSHREQMLQLELEHFNAALAKTFPSISPAAVATVIRNSTRKIGTPGTVIFKEGDVSSDMIFLFSGILDIQKSGHQTATVDSSIIVGHHAYLYSRPRSATVVVRNGPQCVYYNFSVERVSDNQNIKVGHWHPSSAHVVTATAENSKDNARSIEDEGSGTLLDANMNGGSISSMSERRMSALMGVEGSARSYMRDIMEHGDIESNESPIHSEVSSAVESSAVELARQSPTQSRSSQNSSISPRQRPASAPHLSRNRTPLAGRRMQQSSRPSTTSAQHPSLVPHSFADFSLEQLSPRHASTSTASAFAAASSPMRAGQAAKLLNRRLSIVARSKEAVQQQLASTSAAASSCIVFSAAWLLCLTQLEKLRMPEPRHAICRSYHRFVYSLTRLTTLPGNWRLLP